MPVPAPSVYSPLIRCGMPMANSMTSMPRWMSPLESATVLPCSSESSSASSSMLALTRSTNFIITRARRCGFQAAHSFCASTADGTAVSTSAAEAISDLGLHFAGAGVHHVGGAGRRQVAAAAVDEMRNLCGHERSLDRMMRILGYPSNVRVRLRKGRAIYSPSSRFDSARISTLRTLPVTVIGNSSTMWT